MPTPAASQKPAGQPKPSVGGAAKQVAEHASSLAKLELELAGLELKKKVGALGAGLGLGIGAGLLALYALGFLFATIAAALSIFLDAWLALLLVTVGLLALAGILGLLALRRIKKGTPPVPEQAIKEAKLTTKALRSDGKSNGRN
ncbi:MAG TPA: phage holin family protein [Gaiellaceae bacterium]|nr:phage holin family protein [Gaiellaceae bacterium]